MKSLIFLLPFSSILLIGCEGDNVRKNVETVIVDVPNEYGKADGEYFDYMLKKLSGMLDKKELTKKNYEVIDVDPDFSGGRPYISYNPDLKRLYVDDTGKCYGLQIFQNVEISEIESNSGNRALYYLIGKGLTSDVFGEVDTTILKGEYKYKDIGLYHNRCGRSN